MASSGTRRAVGQLLVVEDDAATRAVLRELLEAEGFAVRTAGDGHAALALLEDDEFALIVLDLVLPRLDGWELLDRLAGDGRLATVPVVAITADRSATVTGAPLLYKPFDCDELFETIRRELDRGPRLVRSGAAR